MVLIDKQKAVIENDFNEKGWNAYKIWNEHPSFECSRMAVHNLIKKSRRLGRQSVVKEAADTLPQQQKKTSNRQNNRVYFDGPKKDVQRERL